MSDDAIPPYPRDLTPDERSDVLKHFAARLVDTCARESGRPVDAADRPRLEMEAQRVISQSWIVERLTALEAAVEGKRKGKSR